MKLNEFYYNLPKELIAQRPLKNRDMSRLMLLDRKTGTIAEKAFRDIAGHIRQGDVLVLNDTRVIPVRLYGKRQTGGKVEIFVLNPSSKTLKALVRPSKRIKNGEKVSLENGCCAYIGERAVIGERANDGRFVRFDTPIKKVLKEAHVPLPPYITRPDDADDSITYQTVYARNDGATASPTAGLHFTKPLLEELKGKGAKLVYVTLHTGYGTFAPVTCENIEDHQMHAEYCRLDNKSAKIINNAKSSGKKVFAVGTTSARVLESAALEKNKVKSFTGETKLFIYPGYKFKIVDSIITNFHFPESTLLMLVSAFAGKDFIFEAYKKAIEKKYRLLSYGDAMLII